MSGSSKAEIARLMDRHPSTIGRELRRNVTNHDGKYRAEKAHSYATARRRVCRRVARFSAENMVRVADLIRRRWSAEQISGTLRKTGELHISTETIYRRIRWDKKAGGSLWRHTRIMSKFGRKRYGRVDSRGVLPGKRHISERPIEVEGRQRLGHWEGDTVMGSDMRHCVLTLVERVSGYVIIKKLTARTKEQAAAALKQAISEVKHKVRTITLDNGTEFHDYAKVEAACAVKFYFATPYHSWERGTNENTNGLIRQYLPKGMCMRHVTQADCDTIASELNNRPRRRLGFKTPSERFARS